MALYLGQGYFLEDFRKIEAYFWEIVAYFPEVFQRLGHNLYNGFVFTDTLQVSCWAHLAA